MEQETTMNQRTTYKKIEPTLEKSLAKNALKEPLEIEKVLIAKPNVKHVNLDRLVSLEGM